MKPWNVSQFLKTFLLFLCATPLALSAQSVTFKPLISFHNQVFPEGTFGSFAGPTPLVQGKDGYLYGTTESGGANSLSGTVFKITTDGSKFVTLHVFSPSGVAGDGSFPQSGLVLDTNGSFYGTTQDGGSNGAQGTAFRVGSSLPLHSFVNSEGTQLFGGLVQGTDGELYGTSSMGGANNCGTIFKMTVAGTVKKLYDFPMVPGGCDGPFGNLIAATDGNFYGTVWQGPTNNDTPGWIYKLTAGKVTPLHTFQGAPNDGGYPGAGLLQAADGNFYGTTCYGGNAPNNGTVFRMAPSGKVTVLVNFGTTGAPGLCPRAPLIQASDGNFYGTTETGGNATCSGSTTCGTIFQLTPSGQYQTLHLFDYSQNNGPWGPAGGLVQDTDGSFYGITAKGGDGTTAEGCNAGCGAIYRLTVPGVPPFVLTQQPSGKVAAVITIYGQGFLGTTAVDFSSGVPAVFSVNSGGFYLTATVPAGAITGLITVHTPSGVLSSRYPFKVIPQITSFAPASGGVGVLVTIKGVSLKQTSGVTFGGVAATSFTVVSDTEVTATLPTGAKTGKIGITTKGGTAMSATNFTVT